MRTNVQEGRPRSAGGGDPIPTLAVVDVMRERDGRPQLAIGVVLVADHSDDRYTVELVNATGGTQLIAAARSELRVRHLV